MSGTCDIQARRTPGGRRAAYAHLFLCGRAPTTSRSGSAPPPHRAPLCARRDGSLSRARARAKPPRSSWGAGGGRGTILILKPRPPALSCHSSSACNRSSPFLSPPHAAPSSARGRAPRAPAARRHICTGRAAAASPAHRLLRSSAYAPVVRLAVRRELVSGLRVSGRVRVWVSEQRADGEQDRGDRVHGRPLVLDHVQAERAVRVDIRVVLRAAGGAQARA